MNTLSKTFIAVLLSGGAYAAIACAATACSASPITGITETKTYRNPLIDTSLPDPTVIRAQDGCWYLYATEDIRNTPVYKSENLVDWSFVGTAFTDETRPKWNPKGNLWAPDINYINGQYVLYYAKSEWGGEWTCGIGVATAARPEGPFTDHGCMFTSEQIGVRNSIDEFYIEDSGHKYLFWGSFHGIYGIELSDDGLSVKAGEKPKQIAGTFMEGTYIHKHGGYYYLFGSAGTCCEGDKSTYRVTYGRSKNLFGPYVDKQGRRLMDNHYEVMIKGSDAVAGPGHNAEFVTDDLGQDWIIYHGFKRSDPDAGRVVWMDRVEWIDGWPHVAENRPSTVSESPAVGNILLADPTIFRDKDTYYLYGTSSPDGFLVYQSKDLKHWEGPCGASGGLALKRGDAFGTTGFWAPQVFKMKNKYFMAYTANEQIAIAESDSPLGPFRQKEIAQLPAKGKEIDPFVFFDKGKAYLYHVRLQDGNRIFVAELNKDFKSVKENTARELIHVNADGWENTSKAQWGVSEGPTVIKEGKTYYLFYSCNDFRSPDYAVGYATADNPMGPFVKHGEPLITRRLIGANGTGHGDFFVDREGKMEYVFHTHASHSQVSPRKTAVVQLQFDGKDFKIVEGTDRYLRTDE